MRTLAILAATLALVPAMLSAQQHDSTRRDTTAVTKDTSYGRLGSPLSASADLGLSTSQIEQLQRAINASGCTAGQVTGTVTPETKAGIECVKRQKNITSNDINDVLKALNLSFRARPSGGSSMTKPDTTS